MGILAFGMGGRFESIVNSIMPIGAGAALGKEKKDDLDPEKRNEMLEQIIIDVESIISTEE